MTAMVLRRLLYCMALAGALLFQITNDNYLAHFLLALMVALCVATIFFLYVPFPRYLGQNL